MRSRSIAAWCAAAAFACSFARAAEHVVLKNGYDLICDHRGADGERVRLFFDSGNDNFIEVSPGDIASADTVTLPTPAAAPAEREPVLKQTDMHQLLAHAGAEHDLDQDLLASVVHAESGGNAHAISRTGARGLMQLMPGTATQLGVKDSFAPEANIGGGTAYLDAMLRRYHDNLALALAAYNAGPAAVDRWHGVPPYRETRAYVARVIHEFNRRYAARRQSRQATALLAANR